MFSKSGRKWYRRVDTKMALWYATTFLFSALLICGFLYYRLGHQLLKEIDRFLLDETKEIHGLLSRPDAQLPFAQFEEEIKGRKYYPFFFQVLDKKGEPLYTSAYCREVGYVPSAEILTRAKERKGTRESVHTSRRRTPFRVISTPFYKDGVLTHIVQIGTPLHFVRKSLSNFKGNILAAVPIMLVFGSVGGWMLARKSLAPIGYIASKTRSITSENLGDRLTPRGTGDEMDDLIQTINGMISRLDESFKRVAEFTADASHELKTPLCAMRGEIEVVLSRPRAPEEYQETLARLLEQFDQLNRMINDLILLSKMDSAQAELRIEPIRLDLLLEETGSLFRVLAQQKGLSLHVRGLETITVPGDKLRLQQLFVNLIDNAIKYTSEGLVEIGVEKTDEEAVVSIRDTGIGIPKEEQEKIFGRFYRVDKSRSQETGGVGLGLSIAEWIVKAHRGKIAVKSEPGRGSIFTVFLPLSAEQETSA